MPPLMFSDVTLPALIDYFSPDTPLIAAIAITLSPLRLFRRRHVLFRRLQPLTPERHMPLRLLIIDATLPYAFCHARRPLFFMMISCRYHCYFSLDYVDAAR